MKDYISVTIETNSTVKAMIKLMGKISYFNSLFGGLPLGVASSKTIQLLSSTGRIFGENFSFLSQTVLELSRQKKMFRRNGWMDGQIKINRLAFAFSSASLINK